MRSVGPISFGQEIMVGSPCQSKTTYLMAGKGRRGEGYRVSWSPVRTCHQCPEFPLS
jgi:hypothetical protein